MSLVVGPYSLHKMYVLRNVLFTGNRGFEAPYAVLVLIHGESFEWGGSHPYDGSVMASHGHVIFITLNYRLGVLGEWFNFKK